MEEGHVRKIYWLDLLGFTWIYLDLLGFTSSKRRGHGLTGRVWLLARAVQDDGRDT